jgi:hypothetical protein
MKKTKHAQTRLRQRGFTDLMIEVIENFGCCQRAPGGTEKIFFGKKEAIQLLHDLKRVIQVLDKIRAGTLIVDGDSIITAYKQSGY